MRKVVLPILPNSLALFHLFYRAALAWDIGSLEKENLFYLGNQPGDMNSTDLAGKAGNETDKEITNERRDTDTYKDTGTQDKHH